MFELVRGEQSAVAVCEVDGHEWCQVRGDVAVQVGADDAHAITESEGHADDAIASRLLSMS